ncbi:phenylacetate-CoA oxygenase subunit PaaJ [Micromonospora sp. WMMD1102]|uniref:1,2-phenylacetyl-CoA epoxidase subunit PaaD n=1 Tax=Micromonospora sp. WMMD1102 TaxID=3016105 RepID=UPI0024153FE9|nr:1,2-phenylacetyl-CoA epoxidase subunit PaaD [Micromonospora sp. WMMD1102]MDG4790546.1 phenylacetate-CoA oxygenase subunit PaaJ [Micromonospora sp. WMMD1102]
MLDPELRVLTIEDLGVLRDVTEDASTGRVTVTITPTYTGCPAMDVIRADIRAALAAAGHPEAEVVTVFAPAWTTDWISEAGRAKLAAAGIAPPGPAPAHVIGGGPSTTKSDKRGPFLVPLGVRCPHCGDADTEQVSRFGSTACKSLWRCRACREPFDHLRAF